ncbi:MAG: NAD(P)H-quinone oxidoreductase [Bacteroidota bacterium]
MKAILTKAPGGPEVLTIGEWEKPVPGPNEILVKVAATALNRADTLQRRGMYPPPPGASPILGLEMAGTVVGKGPGAERWAMGDRVCALLSGGGYAEYVVLHEGLALPVPDGLDMEAAAAIPEVFLTAFQALYWLAGLQKGETVLIHAGASGVGTAAIQLARKIGAEVFATASAAKHATCLNLGASVAIDYKTVDFKEVILEKTKGKGVDVVLDFVAASYLQRNLDCLAIDGRMVMLALMGGAKVDNLNLLPILRKRLRIQGSTLRARSVAYKLQLVQEFADVCWDDFAAKQLKPVIDLVCDWKEVVQAHERMEANLNQGKIVLKVS